MHSSRYVVSSGVALVAALLARPTLAQNVTEVQISPPQVQLRVGDRTQVFATAYVTGGNVALGVTFRWNSTDTNVVRVIIDQQSPEIGTLVAIGPGAAVVAAIAGAGTGTRGFTTVAVTAPQPQPAGPAPIAVAPIRADSVLPAATAAATLRSAARIEAQRFGMPTACASGAVVGNGLIATSYQSIRGADRVSVSLDNGTNVADPQVVAYHVANDVAILRIPGQTPDSLPLGSSVRDDQYAWAVSYPACQAVASTSRVRITGTAGALRHTGNLPESGTGAALVDNTGALVGVVSGDRALAASYSRVQSVLSDARSNPRPAPVAEVGRTENHLYGSFVARSDVAGSSVRVSPLESWQWPALAREAVAPLTFTGPMGRYQVELLVSGAVRASTTVRVAPGVSSPVTLAPPGAVAQVAAQPQAQPRPTPAQPQPQPAAPPAARRRGMSPAVPILIVLAGGGAAAFLLTQKKDTTDTGSNAVGTVSVSVPNP